MEAGTDKAQLGVLARHFGNEAPHQARNLTLLIGGVVTAALLGVAGAQYLGYLNIPAIQGFQITPEMIAIAGGAAGLTTAVVGYALHEAGQLGQDMAEGITDGLNGL